MDRIAATRSISCTPDQLIEILKKTQTRGQKVLGLRIAAEISIRKTHRFLTIPTWIKTQVLIMTKLTPVKMVLILQGSLVATLALLEIRMTLQLLR